MTCTCGPRASSPGACSCRASQPSLPANPAGLTQISYRVNDFAGFREALLTPLPGEQQLTGWSPGQGDLGLQVLEWWAYLADVLTFYNERIANDDYLRTAAAQPGPKRNVAGLAGLLGYVPRPGITAVGVVAAIRGTGPPGQQLVIPARTQIISTPAADTPAQLFETELTTTGETPSFTGPSDGFIVLRPDPGLFQSSLSPVTPGTGAAGTNVAITGSGDEAAPAAEPTATHRSVLLAGRVTVMAGEQLVLVSRNWDGGNADWAVVTAGATSTEPDPNGSPNTRLILSAAHWNDPGGTAPPKAEDYQLLRATASAQLWTMPAIRATSHGSGGGGTGSGGGGTGSGGGGTGSGGGGTGSGGGETGSGGATDLRAGHALTAPADPAAQTFTVPLATLIRNVSTGDNVLFTGLAVDPPPIKLLAHVLRYREVVTRTRAAPRAPSGTANPTVVMPHTRLTVRATGDDASALESAVDAADLGGVTMHYGFREVGTLISTPALSLDSLPATVTGPPGLALSQDPAQVALQDANGTGLIVNASPRSPGGFHLTEAKGQPCLVHPLVAPIRLFADLITVSRGTTVRDEILGNGDPATASQSFVLQHSPLIYLPPGKPAGPPATTLTVSVDGVAWKEETAFAGLGPGDQVYVVRELPDGRIQLSFGDGINGARLPLGVSNVTASYRYGAAAPPPPPGHLSTVLQPQPGLASVINPVSITAGADPEPAGQIADAAPGKAVMLSAATSPQDQAPPLISPGDYENFARTVSGVKRACAYWGWDQARQCPDIRLYVAGASDNQSTAGKVREAMSAQPGRRVPLRVKPAHPVTLRVSCQLAAPSGVDPAAIEATATSALTDPHAGLFSPRRMTIGERLYRSQVETALASSGAIAILSLEIERLDPAGDSPDKSWLDPGQDGYFALPATGPAVEVVPQ
jgi:hypothetical protein